MATELRWTPELVERFWSTVAQTRLGEMSFSRHAAPLLLDLLEPMLSKDADYLDFGAGDGHLIGEMLERGYRVAAFEPAHQRAALLRASHAAKPGFLGVIEDAGQAAEFDGVFFIEVIEHILDEDFRSVLDSLGKLVRPGGILIVTTPNDEDLGRDIAYCPVSDLVFHRWQHVRSFTPDGLATSLAGVGFARRWVGLITFGDASSFRADLERLRLPVSAARRAKLVLRRLLGRPPIPPDVVDMRIGDQQRIVYVGTRT